MIVIGIDPSLTATGVARVDTDDRLVAQTVTVSSTGKRDDDWPTRLTRVEALADEIVDHCWETDPESFEGSEWETDLVVIEAPTLSQGRQGGHLDRHGLWWAILARLAANEVPYAVATASARAKYATGNGRANKGAVIEATTRRLPHIQHGGDDNQCDAIWLAAMGAEWLGSPLVELPQANRSALAKVAWPETREEA